MIVHTCHCVISTVCAEACESPMRARHFSSFAAPWGAVGTFRASFTIPMSRLDWTHPQTGNYTQLINKHNRDFWQSHNLLFTQHNQWRSTRTMTPSPFCDPTDTHTACCGLALLWTKFLFCFSCRKTVDFTHLKKLYNSILVDGLNLAHIWSLFCTIYIRRNL